MRGTNQASRGWVAAGAVVALTLSACSDGDEGPTEPSFDPVPTTVATEPSEAPSPAPSPAVTTEALVAPELPAEATEETPEGAAAFAEWWYQTLNYANATGDTEQLRESSSETCVTCENFAQRVEDAYGDGGEITGGDIYPTVDTPPRLEDGGVALAMQIRAESGQIRDADGAVITTLEAEQLSSVMAVLFIEGAWTVGGIQ